LQFRTDKRMNGVTSSTPHHLVCCSRRHPILHSFVKDKGKALGGVYGLVDPHFEFIHDSRKDWKLVETSPRKWRFEGATLTLKVSPEVVFPSDSAVLRQIAAHEDLHVQDARTIVQTTLSAKLKTDTTFKKYYIQRTKVLESTYNHMICKMMTGYVSDIFAKIWNAKVNERDTPAKYRPVQQAVDAAFRKS
jgi:hypothetical protein